MKIVKIVKILLLTEGIARDRLVRDLAIPNYRRRNDFSMARDRPSPYGEGENLVS